MAKLTDVEFYGTGGGCVMFSAKVNDDAWLSTDFDSAYYSDENIELVNDEFINGDGDDDAYEIHAKIPTAPLPTWAEILEAIHQHVPSEYEHAKYIMRSFDMTATCTQGWEYPEEWHDRKEND